VEKANPLAAELLRVCAFLAPDSIPEELLAEVLTTFQPASSAKGRRPERGGWFSRLTTRQKQNALSPTAQKRAFDEAISTLRAYSLVLRDGSEKTLQIHRLVQMVILDSMQEKEQFLYIHRIIPALDFLFPVVSFVTWEQCARYLPQVQSCSAWITRKNLVLLEEASVLSRAGWYLDDRAQYKEAEPLLRRALIIREQILGIDHPATADSLNNLALLYKNRGLYTQAEPLLVRALATNEQQLGASHSDTASSLNNLALLYQTQGRYTNAEPLYVRALTIREQLLGDSHPDTAISLNNLAALYKLQEKYADAERLYLRALAINEQLLGVNHPDTAISLNNLAVFYKLQEKYVDAERLYLRALALNEQLLGPIHLDTALSLTIWQPSIKLRDAMLKLKHSIHEL
jgi:tetratricopeptide (TPR) repeat protein